MSYRVVYGQTRPTWEKIFPTMREANAFASIAKVVPGEPPRSITAIINRELQAMG